jgi:hypothetical protein
MADYAIEFMRIDSCLDRGGTFDYSNMQCATDPIGQQTFSFVPYPVRNFSFLVIVGSSAVLLVLGLLYVGSSSNRETGA